VQKTFNTSQHSRIGGHAIAFSSCNARLNIVHNVQIKPFSIISERQQMQANINHASNMFNSTTKKNVNEIDLLVLFSFYFAP
jgi:hypothetical protein